MRKLRLFWSWLLLGRRRPRWRAWRDADERIGAGQLYIDGKEIGRAKWMIVTKVVEDNDEAFRNLGSE